MNTEQLTKYIIIISLTFLLIVGGIVTIYFVNPSLIGLAPKSILNPQNINKQDTLAKVKEEPLVLLSLERTLKLEEIEKENLKLDSILKDIQTKNTILVDSLKNLYSKKISFKDTVTVLNELIKQHLSNNKQLSDSIKAILQNYDKDKQRISLLENRLKSQEEFINRQQDSITQRNFQEFAKIFNNTNPQEVARILEQLDERDAARIIKMMSTRRASKVLEAMSAEKSAAILLLGTIK